MQLEFVCDMMLTFRPDPLTGEKLMMVRPFGGEEGSGYGEGEGTVNGPFLRGNLRWVNHPHRRSDGAMLPDAHGVIVTPDKCLVMFTLHGRTVLDQGRGKQLLSVIFEAEAEQYRWLNSSFCVMEGLVDAERLEVRAKVFACRSDMI